MFLFATEVAKLECPTVAILRNFGNYAYRWLTL